MTFLCDIKICIITYEPHCVKLFFVNLPLAQLLHFLTFHIFLTLCHLLNILTHDLLLEPPQPITYKMEENVFSMESQQTLSQ